MYICIYVYICIHIHHAKTLDPGGPKNPRNDTENTKSDQIGNFEKSLPKSIGLFDENQRVRTSLCTTPIPLRISPKIRPRRPEF